MGILFMRIRRIPGYKKNNNYVKKYQKEENVYLWINLFLNVYKSDT